MKKKKTNKLTGREIDVLKLVINGDSNSEIAEKLCITDHTVKAHLTHTYSFPIPPATTENPPHSLFLSHISQNH